MASGDLTDLIYNCGTASNGADANYERWDAVKSVNDGKIYIVPRTNIVNHWGYMINQQWLGKLGLKAPTTLDEFTDVCRAFAIKYPDGNGKNDTYGVSFSTPALGSNTIWNFTGFLTSLPLPKLSRNISTL